MKNFDFLAVRHFHDMNALRTYGHNGPLKPNQDKLLIDTVEKILHEFKQSKKTNIKIITTKKTHRHYDTACLIEKFLKEKGIKVNVHHDVRMEVMDQGDLILPEDYKDGDWFTPLDVAWDVICDESYIYKNIFYKFGDHINEKYPTLKESFSRFGQSMGWSLINKYSIIYDLIHNKLNKEDEFLVIVSQSDLPLLLIELQILNNQKDINPENLPYKCWEVYKSGLQDKMKDKDAVGDGNFDIPMGYVEVFDLSAFKKTGFDEIINDAKKILIQNYE